MIECSKCQKEKEDAKWGDTEGKISARVEAGEAEGVGRSMIPDQRRGFQCEDTVAALWGEKMGSRESGNRGVHLLAFRTKAGSCSVAVGTRKWRFEHMNPKF